MINFLTVLGFLGLLGLVILLVIHIIKPNYDQKFVSSTFVWRLSLKYKKRRIPISKIRNILIIICQVLFITIGAFIMAQPFVEGDAVAVFDDRIIIIDASASMQAFQGNDQKNKRSRFTNAVDRVKEYGHAAIGEGAGVSVILAGMDAEFITFRQRLDADFSQTMDSSKLTCTFGNADVEGAITLAESVLVQNPEAKIYFYTATKYQYTSGIELVYVTDFDDPEWNAAILNVSYTLDGVYVPDTTDPTKGEFIGQDEFVFIVEVASYGKNMNLEVTFNAQGAVDRALNPINTMKKTAPCAGDQPVPVYFYGGIVAWDNVQIRIAADGDSFEHDNVFWLFGGTKETITIHYISSAPENVAQFDVLLQPGDACHSPFVFNSLMLIGEKLSSRWNIVIERFTLKDFQSQKSGKADIYIFEHQMPETLPLDGVVLLINSGWSQYTPSNLGLSFGGVTDAPQTIFVGEKNHQILDKVNPSRIVTSQYVSILDYTGFENIMSFSSGYPALLVKNEPDRKIAVFSFNIHRTNLPLLPDLSFLLLGIFEYFMPPTLTKYVYDINETITLQARAQELSMQGPNVTRAEIVKTVDNEIIGLFKTFPYKFSTSARGTYTVTQKLITQKTASDRLYVRIPVIQSDFSRVSAELRTPAMYSPPKADNIDLLLFFAIALLTLLYAERMLHIREHSL